jgi:uncharacterized protein
MSDVLTDPIESLRRLEPKIRAQGVSSLSVFGSRARGDHRPDSDIDILVEIEPGRKFSAFDWVGLCQDLTKELGVEANVFFKRSLEPDFRDEIAADLKHVF